MAQQSCSPFLDLIGSATCIKQGAEAKVYKTILFPSPTFTPASAAANDASDSAASSSAVPSLPPPVPVLLKHRFPKRYRHPHLDAQLTRLRVTSEARSLVRAARGGVCVPALRGVDVEAGIVGMEWIEGWSVREVLGGGAESDEVGGTDDEEGIADVTDAADEEAVPKPWAGLDLEPMASLIGTQLALLHLADVIHGDLTTSNMMLRPSIAGGYDLVMIDFGLAYMSTLWEDKAVDLYVLERAFSSTHPGSGGIFETVLRAYEKGLGKSWKEIGRKLEEVRLRGRKRSMIG